MALEFHLHPIGQQITATGVRHVCRYERQDNGRVVGAGESYFEFGEWPAGLAENDVQPFLINNLPFTMEEGRDLHLHGEVSRSLLRNLVEFRDYWVSLRPERFKPVDIVADRIIDDADAVALPGAVALFSGGVDAAYTVWRHVQGLGTRTRDIRFGVFIDGFERSSLTRREHFERVHEICRKMLASLGLPLIRVRQNWREVQLPEFHADSRQVYAPCLISCLYPFRCQVGEGVLGSGHDYAHGRYPLEGSNPVADRFLASNAFRVLHDGADVLRMDKMVALSQWPEFGELVRVCWHPRPDGSNCGKCEKCVRTMFAFLIASGQIPAIFPQDRSELITALAATKVKIGARCYWREMLEWAEDRGQGQEWLPYIRSKVRKRWKERRHECRQELWEMLGRQFNGCRKRAV
jgi:hypothetical protein